MFLSPKGGRAKDKLGSATESGDGTETGKQKRVRSYKPFQLGFLGRSGGERLSGVWWRDGDEKYVGERKNAPASLQSRK